jgi:hypothetical protein
MGWRVLLPGRAAVLAGRALPARAILASAPETGTVVASALEARAGAAVFPAPSAAATPTTPTAPAAIVAVEAGAEGPAVVELARAVLKTRGAVAEGPWLTAFAARAVFKMAGAVVETARAVLKAAGRAILEASRPVVEGAGRAVLELAGSAAAAVLPGAVAEEPARPVGETAGALLLPTEPGGVARAAVAGAFTLRPEGAPARAEVIGTPVVAVTGAEGFAKMRWFCHGSLLRPSGMAWQ